MKHRSPPTALHRTAVWIAGLLVAASLVPAAADAPVRIGVLAYLGGEYSVDEWAATVRVVETALPNRRVELLPMDHDGLTRAVADGGVDFVITNPGHYVELETGYGISRIATLESDMPVASAVFVRNERSDLKSLKDLAGKRVAIVGTTAFGGFQLAWREFLDVGVDPFRDLKALDSVGFPMTGVVDAVLTQRADAGIVRGCVIERRIAEGALAAGALRVLSPKPSPLTSCQVSSPVYPDWPFAKTRQTPPEDAKRVATALLAMPTGIGTETWTVPVDYQPVHELFRALMIGPYAGLRQMSLWQLMLAHWQWIAGLLAALGAWILHVARVERLVRRRTAELATANEGMRREMSARREAEEREALNRRELDHAARLSLLGEMAGGLAHELNQPLAAITNYADGCELRLSGGVVDRDALSEGIERIRQQAQRAAQVIRRMRNFVKKREPTQGALELNEVVRETLELFEGPARRAGVTLDVTLAETLPAVYGDRIQLQQVLLNLLQNALDASTGSRGRIIRLVSFAESGGAALQVADQGSGMSAEVRARLFEPFFTTKPEGLGLGLALCHSILDSHNGRLHADDAPGGGTMMTLWLPAAGKQETSS